MALKTPEQLATERINANYGDRGGLERALVDGDVNVDAIYAMLLVIVQYARAAIAADMQEVSHRDDWGVPCVYVESYEGRLKGLEPSWRHSEG